MVPLIVRLVFRVFPCIFGQNEWVVPRILCFCHSQGHLKEQIKECLFLQKIVSSYLEAGNSETPSQRALKSDNLQYNTMGRWDDHTIVPQFDVLIII